MLLVPIAPWRQFPGKVPASREARFERPTLKCNAGNIDAFRAERPPWCYGGRGDGLRSIIRGPCPSAGQPTASYRDLAFARPYWITARRGQPIADQLGQHTIAEPMADQRSPGLTAPSTSSAPPLFCAEMTFLRQLRIHAR